MDPNWTVSLLRPGEEAVWIEIPDAVHPDVEDLTTLSLQGIPGCVNDPCLMGFPGSDIQVVANNEFLEANPSAAKLFEVMAIPLSDISKQNNRMHGGEDSPASISSHDIAAGLSKALGKEVKYVDVPLEAARDAMVGLGLPEWYADAYNEYNEAMSQGLGDFTTNDVEEITGHPARSYEKFAREFAQAFG